MVDGAVVQVPAVACVEIIAPTTRKATFDLAVVEYIVDALSAAPAPPSAVVEISVVSSRLLPPEILTTANSTVPALFMAITIIVDCVALTVPNVEPEETVTDIGEETVTVEVAPLVSEELRKANAHAFNVTVNALLDTAAVIGKTGLNVADGSVEESANVIEPELSDAPGVVIPDVPEIVTGMFMLLYLEIEGLSCGNLHQSN